jgi:hypothetical protein
VDRSDELLRDIARIEKEIEELLDYRASLFVRNPSLTGWSRFVAGFQSRMAARQALRHLQYLRLEREIANHTYENLDKTGRRGSAYRSHSV